MLARNPRFALALALWVGLLAGCGKKKAAYINPPEDVSSTPAPASSTVDEIPTLPSDSGVVTSQDLEGDTAIIREGKLDTIYFDFDKSEIRPDMEPILQKNASFLKRQAQFDVEVEGHCDERDTIEYNLALGERRANSAKAYLVGLGIDARRIRVISYGEERPADPSHNEAAYVKNRRDDFNLISTRG
jgi:peptidoglycan-associated lipoprotein